MFETIKFHRSFGSTRIVESIYAVSPPKSAVSDDMRAMVDDLSKFGEIRSRPSSYLLPDETLVIHPSLNAQLRKRLAKRIDADIEGMFMSRVLG